MHLCTIYNISAYRWGREANRRAISRLLMSAARGPTSAYTINQSKNCQLPRTLMRASPAQAILLYSRAPRARGRWKLIDRKQSRKLVAARDADVWASCCFFPVVPVYVCEIFGPSDFCLVLRWGYGKDLLRDCTSVGDDDTVEHRLTEPTMNRTSDWPNR